MAAQFLENCKSTISDCTRLLLTDRRDGLQPSIASLRWASDHVIDEEMASNLIAVAKEFLQELFGSYSLFSDARLDERVKELIGQNEDLGAESGPAKRAMQQRLHQRQYRVAGPNSLWHIDGNHKLI
ncbi:unnamed protein product, partial [Coregonus sp. 'balchen']